MRMGFLAFLFLIAAPAAAIAQPAEAQPVAVRDDGLVASWFPAASGERAPAILVLGGSEGGEASARRIGEALAHEGFGVLTLAWFKAEGLPDQLQEIPLEYFGTALRWLARQPLVDADRIGLYGISKGGEAALLVATRHPELAAVAAAVPSSVVWPGINTANYMDIKSGFSEHGAPLPYLPYDMSHAFTGVFDLYERSLPGVATHPDAAIPVERIDAPILLLSGRADALWPSSEMADQVIARLDAHGFAWPHRHVAYPDAGHGAFLPGAPANESGYAQMGGTPEGNAAARDAMWRELTAFFAQTLGLAETAQ